ncbi:hypothetical protein [Leifsonia sp. A12D58]|uniref:hypothetical protein n=1 Tax=Leifsonia sp. A12D58 TaxID=3397674 RepID=UPI0039E09236
MAALAMTIDRRMRDDSGSASLEFITVGMILLVPLVYLVLALSAVQGGALAVEGAARQAARVYVLAADDAAARAGAARAVEVALADYGLENQAVTVQVDCETPDRCLTPRSGVTVTVRVVVPLPLVPDVLSLGNVAALPVEGTATQIVSRFWHAERTE